MRRTFVVQGRRIVSETGLGSTKPQGTPPIAHHCTLNLTQLMQVLTRPCPGRAAYRVRRAPVCAEEASSRTCCGNIRGSRGRDPPS